MQVRDGMTDVVLTIGPGHSLREAAAAMWRRRVGAAIVLDPDAPGPGVITERDILGSIAAGEDPDAERVADHLTSDLTFASPDWSLEQAASAMVRGRFRHLVVVEGTELKGSISSNCPIVIKGRLEGDISGPSLTVSATGSVRGNVKTGEIRSEGEIAGRYEADVIRLAGRVRAG